jgi:hypothetical protein
MGRNTGRRNVLNKDFVEELSSYPVKSNPGSKDPDDESMFRQTNSSKYLKKIREEDYYGASTGRGVVFKREMKSKEVKIELFMLEGLDEFSGSSLRGRMQMVINKICKELKELFFERSIENDLPTSWENFKVFVEDFCCNKGIE